MRTLVRAFAAALLLAGPLRAAEVERGVPLVLPVAAPLSTPALAPATIPVPPSLSQASLSAPAMPAAAAGVQAAVTQPGAVSISAAAPPTASEPSLSAAPARGPPAIAAAAPRAPFVAGRDHQATAGSFNTVRQRVLAEVGRNWSLPFESVLEGHDALVLGESHRSLSSYQLLAQQMSRLKKAGVAAIGLEGLKAPHQEAVDRWLAAPSAAAPPEAAIGFSPARRAAVGELFEAAKTHGVRLVALGSPLDHWAAQVSELAAGADLDEGVPSELGDQLALAERRYTPGYNEALSEVVLRRRNAAMAERLAAAAAGGGKAVAVVGDAHLDHPDALTYRLFWLPLEMYGSVASELRARLVRAVSVTLTGGLFVSPDQDRAQHRRIHAAAYRLLGEVNAEGKPAFYRTSETTGLYHLGGR